ncbi:phage holin family protein [Deefgea rivuli]|uniref:phage holin family protein n=1 Tax=Deefgea rivuli TaxID=400948 RepID=UPI0004811AF1|nr:phage holin family protein [Deefgea rivuli]
MSSTIRDALGGLIATRFSLFGLEFRDELDRLALMIAFAIGAAFLLVMALGFLGLSVLFGFWEYRIAICALFAVLLAVLGGFAWWKLNALMTCLSSPFPLTSAEFSQDKKLINAAFSAPATDREST